MRFEKNEGRNVSPQTRSPPCPVPVSNRISRSPTSPTHPAKTKTDESSGFCSHIRAPRLANPLATIVARVVSQRQARKRKEYPSVATRLRKRYETGGTAALAPIQPSRGSPGSRRAVHAGRKGASAYVRRVAVRSPESNHSRPVVYYIPPFFTPYALIGQGVIVI